MLQPNAPQSIQLVLVMAVDCSTILSSDPLKSLDVKVRCQVRLGGGVKGWGWIFRVMPKGLLMALGLLVVVALCVALSVMHFWSIVVVDLLLLRLLLWLTPVEIGLFGVLKERLLLVSVIDHCSSEQNTQVAALKEFTAFAHSKQPVEDPCLPQLFEVQEYCKPWHCYCKQWENSSSKDFYCLEDDWK